MPKDNISEFDSSFDVPAHVPEPVTPLGGGNTTGSKAGRPADLEKRDATGTVKPKKIQTNKGEMLDKKTTKDKPGDAIEDVNIDDEDYIEEEDDSTLYTKAGMMKRVMDVLAGLDEDTISDIHDTLTEEEDEDDDESEESGPIFEKLTLEDLDIDYDIQQLFEGDDFSDEFKGKVSDIFNVSLLTAVNENLEKIAESTAHEASKELEEIKEDLVENLDNYLGHFAETFMEENKLAIDSGIKAEKFEEFFESLRGIFVEHNVDVPEEKIDLTDELADRVEQLEDDLNNEITKNVKMKEEIENYHRVIVLENLSADLTENQKAKLQSLSENVIFEDETDFEERVVTLKETYFPEDSSEAPSLDDTDYLTEEEKPEQHPQMAAVVNKLNQFSGSGI